MKHQLIAAAAAVLLSGCASLSPDGGFGAAATDIRNRTGAETRLLRNEEDQRALAAVLRERLAKPITANDAVEIALLNNRALQARYWDLGIAEADLVQAGRLQNPGFSFKRMKDGSDVSLERSLTFNLVGLITAPLAQRIEGRRFEQVRLDISAAALATATEAREAYYEAVAGVQGADYAGQVSAAAEASAELAQRMQQAGNWSKYDAAREQAYHADSMADVSRALRNAIATREKLARVLGLDAADIKLPERLPDLPAAHQLPDVEQAAMTGRADIAAARLDTEATAASLGLTRATRFINVLELGAVRERDGAARPRGYEITVEVPLFDWGSARNARAEAVYMQAVNRLADTAVHARSEARESYHAYQSAWTLAKHYRDVVIPLRQQISQETLLRYNGMLLSVFELLADSREQTMAVNASINALKEFWIADARLQAAIGGHTGVKHD
ncbi:TolC family protein [Massilia sp. SM-13]|uniref:TolC family protein n=1 Tax=Pseudoduganella rhizocola TaxID=3382643 RepID=UPI0038B536A6